MMNKRELYLTEMGLGPVWRLRGQPPEIADTSNMDFSELVTTVSDCSACDLSQSRRQVVFGAGDKNAEWMFVGDVPSADDDDQGEPFAGQAGVLLNNILNSIGLARQNNVYLTHVNKCKPPGNRGVLPPEMSRCTPYLARQISLIQPRLIVAMGELTAAALLGVEAPMTNVRGKVHAYQGIPLIVTYHPACLLSSPQDKARVWEDLCFAKQTMQSLDSADLQVT